MALALNNLQRLICQQRNQTKPNLPGAMDDRDGLRERERERERERLREICALSGLLKLMMMTDNLYNFKNSQNP